MTSISTTFSAVGNTAEMHIKKGESLLYSFDVLASWDGTVVLRKTTDGGHSYTVVATFTTADDVGSTLIADEDANYSFRCTIFTAGTATAVLNNMSTAVVAPSGAGTTSLSTVTVQEEGQAAQHRTILRLTSVPITMVSVTTGNGVGGTTIYTLPEGRIQFLGCMADLALTIAAADQADYTDATPAGDAAVGTLAPANADGLGTDATDDNLATATALTMAAYSALVQCPSEAILQFDGTSTPANVVVNALIDAADIDDGVTTTLYVSGSITLDWMNLGDF